MDLNGKWWLRKEKDSSGAEKWVCMKCANTGGIPAYIKDERNQVQELVFSCDCLKSKKAITLYTAVFPDFQFPFDPEIILKHDIDYPAIYLLYMHNYFYERKKNPVVEVNKSIDILENYFKKGR